MTILPKIFKIKGTDVPFLFRSHCIQKKQKNIQQDVKVKHSTGWGIATWGQKNISALISFIGKQRKG